MDLSRYELTADSVALCLCCFLAYKPHIYFYFRSKKFVGGSYAEFKYRDLLRRHVSNKKLCYRRRTARCAMSVKILSSVETSCTTDKYTTSRMELEGYSWSTCSKQPRLVDCRIGVVNKLDRRRRRRVVDNAYDLPRRNFLVRSLGQISRGMYPNFWRYPNFLITQCRIGERKPPWQIPSGFVQSFR